MRDLLRTVKGSQLRRSTAEATPQGNMLMKSSARLSASYVSLLTKRRPIKTAMRDLLRTVKRSQLRRGTSEVTPLGCTLMWGLTRLATSAPGDLEVEVRAWTGKGAARVLCAFVQKAWR